MDWIIEFDIAAAIITSIILWLFIKKKNYPTKTNRIYFILMLVGLIASILDIVSIYAINNAVKIPLWVNLTINTLFLLSMNMVAFIYYFYVGAVVNEFQQLDNWHEWAMGVLDTLDFILIVTSPFTGWVFYFDDNGKYCSGPLKPVIYAIALFVLVACLIKTFRNREILSSTQKNCVYLYTISNLCAVIVQCIYPNLLITNFVVSIAFMIIYITLQRPEDKMDSLTQLKNRVSFLEELNREAYNRKQFYILAIKIENLNNINEMIGVALTNTVIRAFANTLTRAGQESGLYRVSGSKFVYLGNDDEEIQSMIQKIDDKVKKGFEVQDMIVWVELRYCVIKYPEHGSTSKELESAIKYCFKDNNLKNNTRVIYADEKMLEEFKRKNAIKDIISHALKNRTFKVYYQPIYNCKEMTFDSVEALIRLKDEKYGFISPDEFIPMAEQNGQIVEIGEYVIDEVCRMMAETDILKYKIKHVHINLSAVQCMQRDLNERIQKIIQKHGVDADKICFEITETAALHSDSYLSDKLKKITETGFKLVLDDYGSGFATFGYLFKYPFSVVKLDKEMIWQTAKDKKAMVAVGYVIEMMKELGLEIVAEGVETKEQAEQLIEAKCDFFQGYFYAKPMPEDAFIRFIREKNYDDAMNFHAGQSV